MLLIIKQLHYLAQLANTVSEVSLLTVMEATTASQEQVHQLPLMIYANQDTTVHQAVRRQHVQEHQVVVEQVD